MWFAVALAAIFGAAIVVVVALALYNAWDLWNRRDEDKPRLRGLEIRNERT